MTWLARSVAGLVVVLSAAALIPDPPIIFLDEPTSALDPLASLVVRDLIKDLAEKAGKTVFVKIGRAHV